MGTRRWCLLVGHALIIGLIFNSSGNAAAARCTSRVGFDARVTGCIKVIEQGRPATPSTLTARLKLASAHFHKGDLDHAIDAYKRVIAEASTDPLAAYNRAAPDLHNKEPLPLSGSAQALGRDRVRARAHLGLGIASFQAGLLEQSQNEFRRLSSIDPGNADAALWLDLARRRAGQASELADRAKRLDMSRWPAPVVRLLLGQATTEAVLAAANRGAPAMRRARRCEASFFAGELMLDQSRETDAMRLIDQAVAECPWTSHERSVAEAEARVLRVMP